MASLDDFFKKRDKKKKTTKSKLDIDEISKKLEANNENNADDFDQENNFNENTKEVASSNSASAVANGEGVDEEWMPFDAGENKDLTGLKINTATWNVDDEFGENEGGYEGGEKKPSFKWGEKVVSKRDTDDDQNDDEKEEESEEKQPANKQLNDPTSKPLSTTTTETKTEAPSASSSTSTAYVPPSMRNKTSMESSTASSSSSDKQVTAPASSSGAYVPPSMRNRTGNESSMSAIPSSSVNYRKSNKSQPNIMDTMEFPTLDNAEPSSNEKAFSNNTTNEKFELAKRTGKVDQKSGNNMIDIGNSFSALSS